MRVVAVAVEIPVERRPPRAAPVQTRDPELPGAVLVNLRRAGRGLDKRRYLRASLGVERVEGALAVATALCLCLHLSLSSPPMCVSSL